MSEENLAIPITPDILHIRAMIAEISSVGKDDLRGHMDSLKKALKENESACRIILPEEIGALVAGISLLENKMVFDAKIKEEKKTLKKQVKEKSNDRQAILNMDDIPDDEL